MNEWVLCVSITSILSRQITEAMKNEIPTQPHMHTPQIRAENIYFHSGVPHAAIPRKKSQFFPANNKASKGK